MDQDHEPYRSPTAAEHELLRILLTPASEALDKPRASLDRMTVRTPEATLQDLEILTDGRRGDQRMSSPVVAAYPDVDGIAVIIELWLCGEYLDYVEIRRWDQKRPERLAVDALHDLQAFALDDSDSQTIHFSWGDPS